MKKVQIGWSWRTHVLLAWLEKTQAWHKSSSHWWWLCDDLGCNFRQWEITVGDSRRKSNSWIIHQDFEGISSTSNFRSSEGYHSLLNKTVPPYIKPISLKCGYCIKNIKIIDWPAHSYDLNPIENVWDLLARRVYANGRVFSIIDELRSCILTEWQNLETGTIGNLITSIPQRYFSVFLGAKCS